MSALREAGDDHVTTGHQPRYEPQLRHPGSRSRGHRARAGRTTAPRFYGPYLTGARAFWGCLTSNQTPLCAFPPHLSKRLFVLLRSLPRLLILATLPGILLACRTSPRQRSQDSGREPYLITAEELQASRRANLYDAARELRPRWFTRPTRANTGEAYVYIDDQVVGTIGTLRRFSPNDVAELRYLSPTEAQVQFGQRNQGRAAIVLVLVRD